MKIVCVKPRPAKSEILDIPPTSRAIMAILVALTKTIPFLQGPCSVNVYNGAGKPLGLPAYRPVLRGPPLMQEQAELFAWYFKYATPITPIAGTTVHPMVVSFFGG